MGGLPTKAGGVDLKGWRWCTTPFSLSRPVSALVRQVETFMSAWAQRGVRPAQPPHCLPAQVSAAVLAPWASGQPRLVLTGTMAGSEPPPPPSHPPAARGRGVSTCTWSPQHTPLDPQNPQPQSRVLHAWAPPRVYSRSGHTHHCFPNLSRRFLLVGRCSFLNPS